ncbi:MAG: polysaccharide deacetylase family protein [Lachnospiraceae bacterium]|nr:polysaccharide deacetylase family protein [Lachnospiraceae bacterium]
MYIKRIKKFIFGVAAGLLAMAGTMAVSFPTYAEEDMKAVYWIYNNGSGWSAETKDNRYVQAPADSYATAIWASLENQPAGMTGTIEYQVNLSGFGWMRWSEHATEAGNSSGNRPLEAVKMRLTGQVGEQYDVYYSVLQNGDWTELVMNGEKAGVEGQGLRVDGLRVALRKKGTGLPEEPVTVLGNVDPTRPMVALTYDDGPSAVTSRILDSLEAHGARATFYMVGNRMGSYQSTIQRMQALGCELGSHTWNHSYLTQLSADGIRGNLNQFDTTLQTITGVRSVTMRPPGGFINSSVQSTLASYGQPAIMWSIDTLDWKTRNAQSTINTVLSKVQDGDIILMHDLYGATADASAVLIPELINRGYQLVTISELAAYRGGMQPGQVYYSFRP